MKVYTIPFFILFCTNNAMHTQDTYTLELRNKIGSTAYIWTVIQEESKEPAVSHYYHKLMEDEVKIISVKKYDNHSYFLKIKNSLLDDNEKAQQVAIRPDQGTIVYLVKDAPYVFIGK